MVHCIEMQLSRSYKSWYKIVYTSSFINIRYIYINVLVYRNTCSVAVSPSDKSLQTFEVWQSSIMMGAMKTDIE